MLRGGLGTVDGDDGARDGEVKEEDLVDGDDDLPPGLDDDLLPALRQFAGAYVKGLGGLVMGVVDGFTRGAPAGYMTYGGTCRERGRI